MVWCCALCLCVRCVVVIVVLCMYMRMVLLMRVELFRVGVVLWFDVFGFVLLMW